MVLVNSIGLKGKIKVEKHILYHFFKFLDENTRPFHIGKLNFNNFTIMLL